MNDFDPNVTQEVPLATQAKLVEESKPEAPAEKAPPTIRPFARTRFPKLPALTEKQIAALPPVARAGYLSQKKHEDSWGHLPPNVHGHLRGIEQLAPNAVENHARTRKTDPVHFAAARAYFKWPLGKEMTLEEFDAAVDEALNHPHGK